MNKAKRAIEHLKTWGVGKYSQKPQKPVKRPLKLPESHVQLDRLIADVRKQVNRKPIKRSR